MIGTSTDISALVNGAFSELECCGSPKTAEHDGDKAAFYEAHGCTSGFLCRAHFKRFLEVKRPQLAAGLECNGYILCFRLRREVHDCRCIRESVSTLIWSSPWRIGRVLIARG